MPATDPVHAQIEQLEGEIFEKKQALSALRRRLAPEPIGAYTLKTSENLPIPLAELFAGREDLLVIHNMGKKCVYCTLWADVMNGVAQVLLDRTAVVITSPDEPAVISAFARSRGWTLPMASIAGTSFAKDLGFEPEPGKFWPGVSALCRHADGRIERTGWSHFGPGDDFCPPLALFDLLRGGAGSWKPKFEYVAS